MERLLLALLVINVGALLLVGLSLIFDVLDHRRLERIIMSEAQDAVDAITAQLGKARDEILAEIAALEAQVAAGQAPDLSALKAAAQALDDVVPDAPVDAPVDAPE